MWVARPGSCRCRAPSAGNCAACGLYADGTHHQPFVANQHNGTWGNVIEVPGSSSLNTAGWAEIKSLSCASAGHCAAGGFYTDQAGRFQAFVVSQA